MRYNSDGRKGLVDIECEILKLYDNSDLTVLNIAKRLCIGKSTVFNYLKKNNRRRYSWHGVDKSSFSEFTPASCYWAGFIAADGNISNKLTNVHIELNYKDAGHIVKALGFVKDIAPKIVYGEKDIQFKGAPVCKVKFCKADISSTDIVRSLCDNFNITPNKSFTIQPPTKIPEHLISHYIRGYFDGDGSIYWNKSHKCGIFNICSGSKDMLVWIGSAIRNNVDYDFSPKAFSLRPSATIYFIERSHKSAEKIFHWIYKDSVEEIRLDRKYERYLEYTNTTH